MNNPPPNSIRSARLLAFAFSLLVGVWTQTAVGQAPEDREPWYTILPEQRCLDVRDPAQLCPTSIPVTPRPPTVSDPQEGAPPHFLSLSEAINSGLRNMEVVRVLGGVTATSTGQTIYDVAITNTTIDQARATFDPTLRLNNSWTRADRPFAVVNPGDPTQSLILGNTNGTHALDMGLSKRTATGGILDLGVGSTDVRRRAQIAPLNPVTDSAVDLSYTQPLLRGAGTTVNRIPIVLARIDTERSYFQFKDTVQSHVLSVIGGYWNLVLARTDLWAREQQVAQLQFANERTQTRLLVGDANAGDAAQTRVAYENFRASLIGARANLLQQEAAFRNVLGFPPYDPEQLVPVSPLRNDRMTVDWESILELAEVQRPDLIELKLVLEADLQRLFLQRNQALPQLDGVALYRWNGLEGTMPGGGFAQSAAGQFADWNFGVNFSVPLGLRNDRALLRRQELVIRRDRANIQQGLHQTVHLLAANLRNLDQFYEQYLRFQEVREAAEINLEQQMQAYNVGNIQFITVLQAIVDWGNSITSEAQALVQYNIELANLERETGTILETHGIAFFEERYGSLGPLGRFSDPACYPEAVRPSATVDRYEAGSTPSEEFFELKDPTAEGIAPEDIRAEPINGAEMPSLDDARDNLEGIDPLDLNGSTRVRSGIIRAASSIKQMLK